MFFLEKETNSIKVWDKFEEAFLNFNKKYLSITFTMDLRIATKDSDLIVIAIPIPFLEYAMKELKEVYSGEDIVIASKGIDVNSQLFGYEIVRKYLGDVPIGVISGGTFAKDMFSKKVMGITLGTCSFSVSEKIKKYFENEFLKVQYGDDVTGVSICGAIKNVMAIGFGMLDGANYPPSSKFLFLTDAINEIRTLIRALGGNDETIMSYAGIDDIMMTCTSVESRSYRLGFMVGSGASNEEILEYKNNTTIEGLGTTLAVNKLACKKNINLPLTSAIYRILYDNETIDELIKLLRKRES